MVMIGTGNELFSTSRSINYTLLSLSQRFELASTFVLGLVTFLLAQWYHGSFSFFHTASPRNVAAEAMVSSSNLAQSPSVDLRATIIGGFSMSCPNSPTELSISAPVADFEAVYLQTV